jgi:hypothetical protein
MAIPSSACTLDTLATNQPYRGYCMIQRNIELGYGTVTKEAMQDRTLSLESNGIYAYLCSFAGGKDVAWPSMSKMAYDLQKTEKTIRKHIAILVKSEYIEIDKYRYEKSKRFANNHYNILK